MADFTFNLAGFSATHSVTAADQQATLDAMKAEMAAAGDWPSDGQGGTTEPTNAQVAQWIADVWITREMARVAFKNKQRIVDADHRAARDALTPVEFTKVA